MLAESIIYYYVMSSKGCLGGCIHRREIKIEQMKESYVFRCDMLKKYMTQDNIKCRCNMFQGEFTIKEYSLDEFLDM